MISLAASRAAASDAEVARAIAALDHSPGLYLGCDAGIAGLHPPQACLFDGAALALRLSSSGVVAHALDATGHALLALPAFARWQAQSRPGAMRRPVLSLRAFLALFAPAPEVRLAGALPFAAHRLAGPACAPGMADEALGVVYLPVSLLERDAQGAWWRVTLTLPGPQDGRAASASAAAAAKAEPALAVAAAGAEPRDDFSPGGHAAMVALAVGRLADPGLVSLTLSQSFRRRFDGSPATAFERLRAVNPAPVMFFLNDGEGTRLFGASPDLQLVVAGNRVQSLPVCGTVARRAGAVGEAASFQELINEAVDAASLAVCSDAMRDDLAGLCEPGSLRLTDRRRPMSLATVVHTVDHIEGRLRPGIDAWDAIAATAAPVMLTGTPRTAALSAIADLEASPRGWYGGLMVDVRADGTAVVGTILRAAAVRDGVAEVRTGGDLLADSDPAREEAESRLKAISLWRALGLESPSPVGNAQGASTPADGLPLTVGVLDGRDPFIASLRDCLGGLGVHITPESDGLAPAVLAGSDATTCDRLLAQRGTRHLLACGDAAVRVLARAGFRTTVHPPRHGRSVECQPLPGSPWQDRPAQVGVYGCAGLEPGPAIAGWSVWACDPQGHPLALAHEGERTVCLLFRPDSLLCGPGALGLLSLALRFIAGPDPR